MTATVSDLCNTIEECYEFMLAYAAQGLREEGAGTSGARIREFLGRAVNAISDLEATCLAAVRHQGVQPRERYECFLAVVDRDARDSLAAIQLVLAQPAISSQLIDNLNASIHLRALLTDLFLLTDILKLNVHGSAGSLKAAKS